MVESVATSDSVPANGEVIEVRAEELSQLFNPIDPAPIEERDLDPRIEAFIVEWSRDLPRRAPLALQVRLAHPAGMTDEVALLREAIHGFFANRGQAARRRLRHLFQNGRISLVIGLTALAVLTGAAQMLTPMAAAGGFGRLLQDSLSIGGWVAMWRPLEVFLYDWWPIRADAKLFDRLAAMPVRISYETGG